MAEQNFTVDTGLTVTGTGGNITGATNISADGNISANVFVGNTANITLLASDSSWSFDNTGKLSVPNGGVISTPDATGGAGGYDIGILAGAADPTVWNSNRGGDINIQGGYGSFNDGSGAPGGNVNLYGGQSPENTSGNVTINTGAITEHNWIFDATGTLTAPGAIQLAVYANATVRDAAIASPQPGMMVYITDTGMQVYGTTQWNTVTGSGT